MDAEGIDPTCDNEAVELPAAMLDIQHIVITGEPSRILVGCYGNLAGGENAVVYAVIEGSVARMVYGLRRSNAATFSSEKNNFERIQHSSHIGVMVIALELGLPFNPAYLE